MTSEKTYVKAGSIPEALECAYANTGTFRYLAGGTDVIVNKYQGNDDATCLIDLTGIRDLREIKKEGAFLKIGSLVRLDELKNEETIKKEFPVLIEAANAVASPLLRKTATLGGNLLCENRCSFYNQSEWWREAVGYCLKCDGDICIATGGKKNCFSKFVSDTAPALISMDALIEVIDKDGTKTLPVEEIYTGDGVNPRSMSRTAIIRSVLLPLGRQFKSSFRKLRRRESVEFSSLTTAVSLHKDGKIKIAVGGVDPKPVVVEGKKGDDKNQLIAQAVKKARIVENDVFTRAYRKEMMGVYLQRSCEELGI